MSANQQRPVELSFRREDGSVFFAAFRSVSEAARGTGIGRTRIHAALSGRAGIKGVEGAVSARYVG